MDFPDPAYGNFLARRDVQHAMANTNAVTRSTKRKSPFPESSGPKRVELPHDDRYVKLELNSPEREFNCDDIMASGDDEPDITPVPTQVQENKIPGRSDIKLTPSGAELITKKMHGLNGLEVRAQGCRAEIERIATEI